MNWIEIVLTVYGAVVLVIIARNIFICNRERTKLKLNFGTDTSFVDYVRPILKNALSWPGLILWFGLEAWLKELE